MVIFMNYFVGYVKSCYKKNYSNLLYSLFFLMRIVGIPKPQTKFTSITKIISKVILLTFSITIFYLVFFFFLVSFTKNPNTENTIIRCISFFNYFFPTVNVFDILTADIHCWSRIYWKIDWRKQISARVFTAIPKMQKMWATEATESTSLQHMQ